MRLALASALFAISAALAGAQQVTPLYAALDPYAAYQLGVSASMDANISSASAMDASLMRAAQYDPTQLARGRLAYAAITAAQSPAFIAGIQARVRAAGRAAVLRQLQRDPTYARRRPPGAVEASALVLSSMAADVARLRAAATHYESIGNSIGGAAWNTPLDPAHRQVRDEQLHALAAQAPALAPDLTARIHVGAGAGSPLRDHDAFGGVGFWDALAGRASATPLPDHIQLRRDRAGVMDRALTLGALVVINATPAERARAVAALDDPPTRTCLAMEQLEFRQCASVSHSPDEDAFCLAQHGFSGVAECFSAMIQ
ncbi:MAG: hypothetical protein HY054_09975 [Proteobacteria bacterium]|nr:hypothetical protein [Pseudomonadota bacterium]